MLIPRHWAHATGEAVRPDGTVYALSAWGWSTDDREAADRMARERLAAMLLRATSGADMRAYPYGVRPLREEILQEWATEGEPAAVLTRNSYGCAVLNTRDVMFVDVDVPHVHEPWWRRWFGRAAPPRDAAGELRAALKARAAGSFRLYRTAAGFRVLVTDRTLDPASDEARQLMEALGADPAFVTLCRRQRSFRARLSPKPWRCGLGLPPGAHPRSGPELAAFATWRERYTIAARAHATCAFVEAVGWGRVAPEVRDVLEQHDRLTGADSGLPLA